MTTSPSMPISKPLCRALTNDSGIRSLLDDDDETLEPARPPPNVRKSSPGPKSASPPILDGPRLLILRFAGLVGAGSGDMVAVVGLTGAVSEKVGERHGSGVGDGLVSSAIDDLETVREPVKDPPPEAAAAAKSDA